VRQIGATMLKRVAIPSPNFSSRGGTAVRLVVLHTAQGSTSYRSLGSYFSSSSAGVSSHVGIDDTPGEVGEYVRRPDKAWTQGNANPYSVSAELCGWAEWTAAQWHGEHGVMLSNAAQWIAEECAHFGIPLRALSAAEAQGGKAGVCDHAALGAAGGGHWDIGSGISVAELVAMAAGGTPATQPETEVLNMVLGDKVTGGVWIAYEDGAVHTLDGAPYLGSTNNDTSGAKGFPCIGIAALGDGYVLIHEFGTGKAGDRDPRSYHFRR
jgi:hypothetical protein